MNGYLRQSTASQTRTIGPFIDSGDFITPDDGLTISNTDIRLKKNGAADVAKNSGGGTADVNGMYAVTWDATDTDTVGELQFSVLESGALLVWGTYVVLEEAVYDALFAASAPGYVANAPVDAVMISGDSVAADRLETMLDGTGGNNLSLGRLLISNSGSGAAVDIQGGTSNSAGILVAGGTSNGPAISLLGTGSGNAMSMLGGSGGGKGLNITGGAGNVGVGLTGGSAASAVEITGGATSGKGLVVNGTGTGDGVEINAGATGVGVDIRSTANDAVAITAAGGGGYGVNVSSGDSVGLGVYGGGTGTGIEVTGGATGAGVTIAGGGTSGDGVVITATSGDGLVLTGGGAGTPLNTDTVDQISDGVAERAYDGAFTLEESIRLANSANAAKLSGAATTTVVIRDVSDTKDRITATVDASGNRTAVTVDAT